MANRCYYRSATVDPQSQLPLYVLDLTHVPAAVLATTASPANDTALKTFTDTLISQAPDHDHALVVLTNGLHREGIDDSAAGAADRSFTLIRFIKLIPAASRENLQKMYIVHGTWILKSVVDVFSKFHALASNAGRQPSIIKCDTLTALSHHIDITKLPISLHTYIIDKIYFNNSRIILTRDFPPLYGEPLTIYGSSFPLTQFQRIFNNLISYLSRPQLDVHLSRRDWNTIIKCSSLPAETKLAIDILSDCLKRGQLVSLSDYSFVEHYMIFVKFILKLSNSSTPLIPLQLLLTYKVDFSNVTQINAFLNKALLYKHHLSSSTTYDNAYILIKVFKIFKYLALKVHREISLIDPSSKNSQKATERHKLRLVLAFTKILYSENASLNNTDSLASTDTDDDVGFDYLFRFIRSLLDNYDTLTVLGTPHTIDDFNNHISTDDFIAFENFKINALGDSDAVEARVVNNLPPSHTSPVKAAIVPSPPPTSRSPSPPMPRKIDLFALEKHDITDKQPMTPDSSQAAPIPVTQSQVDIVMDSLESLGIEDDAVVDTVAHNETRTDVVVVVDDAFTTPTRPTRVPRTKPSMLSLHETIVPMVNSNLRKYTDRDLALQEEVERQRLAELKKQEHAREVERGVRRGERKVSRLARLYEEKYMQ